MDNPSQSSQSSITCPVCNREFHKDTIEDHVNKCLFLNTQQQNTSKRSAAVALNSNYLQPLEKRKKIDSQSSSNDLQVPCKTKESKKTIDTDTSSKAPPLAEQMRPVYLDDVIGQTAAFGSGSMLRSMLQQNKIPNMILWGPPGCGKTSLANVVANICKSQNNMRFVKMSATVAGIGDVKEVVKVAKNEAQFKRQTVLFMDEIHRFNKLQQDTFLPHVENGTITLIGATTENPSFSLNNALLSRCRVVVMEKLTVDEVMKILLNALEKGKGAVVVNSQGKLEKELGDDDESPRYLVERACLQWLAEVSDGDARVALGALELALKARDPGPDVLSTGPAILSLDDIKNGIKRSHIVYDRVGEEHYNTISALHKSIRASDDNAALYWLTRMLQGGDDPLYIARRLVRIACEDIGLGDQNAIVEAVACLQGCQHIGMPECDVLLAQCAVRLARAPKSREVYHAMKRCQHLLSEFKGPLPPIPLHLRNAPTKLMKQLGYGRGYNTSEKHESGLTYMPEGLEGIDFFCDSDSENR